MSEELTIQKADQSQQMALEPEAVKDQINLIQKVMKDCMKVDEHFGVIPGCGKKKPSLLKSGAEKLSLLFKLSPSYNIQRSEHQGGHREYEIICTLTHITTGNVVSEGVGACSTLEGKYRYRNSDAQLTDTEVPKGYWDLRRLDPRAAQGMLGGPGHSAKKNDTGQWVVAISSGKKVDHDNPADYWNTVLKMAKKRAYIDAMLSATAASDIFTQDLDEPNEVPENPDAVNVEPVAPARANPAPSPQENQQQNQQPQQNQDALHLQAWDKFHQIKDRLDEAGRNYAIDQLNNHNYQIVLNWMNGG